MFFTKSIEKKYSGLDWKNYGKKFWKIFLNWKSFGKFLKTVFGVEKLRKIYEKYF